MTRLVLPPTQPRKSKHFNLDRRNRFKSRLRDIYANARCFRQPFSEFSDTRSQYWLEARAQCTAGEVDWLFGFDAALWDAMYERDLQWRLGFESPAGAGFDYVSVRDKHGKPPTHGGHCWRDSDVPFSPWQPL